jgi:ATP-dependent DNA helicase PIF1
MIDIPNVPPHRLVLKVGIPVVLLRNLSLKNGLCNGVVMVVESITPFLVTCVIPSQSFRRVLIPRIHFRPDGHRQFPYKWCRRQFPIVPAFSLTISKSN